MSLIVKIQINNTPLVVISAQRVEGSTDPLSMNKYKLMAYDYRENEDGECVNLGFTWHRYGCPAEDLATQMIHIFRHETTQREHNATEEK